VHKHLSTSSSSLLLTISTSLFTIMQLNYLLAGLLAVASSAVPVLSATIPERCQSSGACAGLGSQALDTLPYSFTITAFSTSKLYPNSNTTGQPMVIGSTLSNHGYTEYRLLVRSSLYTCFSFS
jgi:hypothetical protein